MKKIRCKLWDGQTSALSMVHNQIPGTDLGTNKSNTYFSNANNRQLWQLTNYQEYH